MYMCVLYLGFIIIVICLIVYIYMQGLTAFFTPWYFVEFTDHGVPEPSGMFIANMC